MKFRTIIFEDDSPVRLLLQMSAERRGHDTLTFESPTFCALSRGEACSHEGPCSDVIMSDHQMPGMSGLEFFALLREKKCRVPNKVLVTAATEEELRELAEKLGCDFIPKPFQIHDIDAWLQAAEQKIPPDRILAPVENLY